MSYIINLRTIPINKHFCAKLNVWLIYRKKSQFPSSKLSPIQTRICQVWLKLVQSQNVWEKNNLFSFKFCIFLEKAAHLHLWLKLSWEDFLILTIMSLRIFSITCMSPWRKTWTFIWKEINHLHLSMFYAISRGNGPSHYGEKKIFVILVFLLFYYLPFKKGHDPSFE